MEFSDRQQVIFDAIKDEGGMWIVYRQERDAYLPRPLVVEILFSEEEAFDLANACTAWAAWAWSYYSKTQFLAGHKTADEQEAVDNAIAEVEQAMPHPEAGRKRNTFGVRYSVLRVI